MSTSLESHLNKDEDKSAERPQNVFLRRLDRERKVNTQCNTLDFRDLIFSGSYIKSLTEENFQTSCSENKRRVTFYTPLIEGILVLSIRVGRIEILILGDI